MKQLTFLDAEYGGKRERTRREVFLAEMHRDRAAILEGLWKASTDPLATMLRIHSLQQWYGLSDPAMEEELYEIASMRQFAELSLSPRKPVVLRHEGRCRADAESGLVHSVIGSPANAPDVTKAHDLPRGDETVAFGDAGYLGVEQRPERKRQVEWLWR